MLLSLSMDISNDAVLPRAEVRIIGNNAGRPGLPNSSNWSSNDQSSLCLKTQDQFLTLSTQLQTYKPSCLFKSYNIHLMVPCFVLLSSVGWWDVHGFNLLVSFQDFTAFGRLMHCGMCGIIWVGQVGSALGPYRVIWDWMSNSGEPTCNYQPVTTFWLPDIISKNCPFFINNSHEKPEQNIRTSTPREDGMVIDFIYIIYHVSGRNCIHL